MAATTDAESNIASETTHSEDGDRKRKRSPSEEGEEREETPPLPDEEPPQAQQEDDGWEAVPATGYDNEYWFYNRFTGKSQWENPRVPDDPFGRRAEAETAATTWGKGEAWAANPYTERAPGTERLTATISEISEARRKDEAEDRHEAEEAEAYQGYNPKIHGNFDPNADYAKYHFTPEEDHEAAERTTDAVGMYEQQANFNRFTGAFQAGSGSKNSEYHNDENKSKRQMNAFFDVDRAANAHEGRSLKAERAGQKISKKEAKKLNDAKRAKKEQKRRDFLMS